MVCLTAPIVILYFFHEKMPQWFGPDNYAIRGQFGDQFGALNAVFSGIAAGGLILTLWCSLSQLALLKKEHKDARDDRIKDERVDSATLRLRAVTSEIEIASSLIRIATVLFHEADARCIITPGDHQARNARDIQRNELTALKVKLDELLSAASKIRTEYSKQNILYEK